MCLIWCTAFYSWAGIASKSTASRSNAKKNLMDSSVFDYAASTDQSVLAAASALPSVVNTVDLTKVRFELAFNNNLGNVSYEHKMLNSSGYVSLVKPTTFSEGLRFSLIINKGALPSVGNYLMSVRFSSNTGYNWKSIAVYPRKATSNASALYGSSKSVSFQQFSGDFYFNTVVEITSSTTDLYVRLIPDGSFQFPVGGYFSIRFEPTTAAADVPGMPVNDGEVQSNISNGVDNISSGVDDISENTSTMVDQNNTIISGIANIIQTISNQLSAFWNQLAGEFTNLYNKMTDQHEEQLENDNANTKLVTDAIEKHGNFIIEGLKGLFIPSDTYFKSWFDDMYQFFSDRLGFLMLPIDLLVKFVGLIQNASSSTSGFPFPEFKWLDGTVLIPAQTVGFTFLETDWGKDIQTKLYFVGDVIMIGALLSLTYRKFEEVLRN